MLAPAKAERERGGKKRKENRKKSKTCHGFVMPQASSRTTNCFFPVVLPPSSAFSLSALTRDSSTRVAEARGESIDRQMDAGLHAVVGVAGAVAAQELELQVVQRIEIGQPVAQRTRKRRV